MEDESEKIYLRPLGDRVIILPSSAETKTAGGIIIPDTAQEKPLKGLVLAVGPGLPDQQMEVKPGDSILYGKYAGSEFEIEYVGDPKKQVLIMRQHDILCVDEKIYI